MVGPFPILICFLVLQISFVFGVVERTFAEPVDLEIGNQRKSGQFSFPGNQMSPTILNGASFVVDFTHYNDRAPQRGDMVLIRSASDDTQAYVRRIIALPLERLDAQDDTFIVTGRRIPKRQIDRNICETLIRKSGLFERKSHIVCYEENLDEARYFIFGSRYSDPDRFRPISLNKNEFYTEADNRSFGSDPLVSNVVHRNRILGKVVKINK